MDERVIAVIVEVQAAYAHIEAFKETPGTMDPRSIACALTRLDEAMLWLANARQ